MDTKNEVQRAIHKIIATQKAENYADLARKCGITQTSITSWKSGRKAPGNEAAIKIAKLAGVPIPEFLVYCSALRARSEEAKQNLMFVYNMMKSIKTAIKT